MRKWLAVSLLLVFSFGITAELLEGPCADDAVEQTCCVCLCHVPALQPAALPVAAVSVSQQFAPLEVHERKSFFDKSFFQPPRALA